MVYYHTSANVKLLRNIINDYDSTPETSPYEYMKCYIEKCPETIEDAKISWIAETFLSFCKHQEFYNDIVSHLQEELSSEDQEYFKIMFHAVIFEVEPKDMQHLYKCFFNLCKSLLDTFTKFLSNNEILTFISQVAQVYYDTNYITEKIIGPLFTWQPYIGEMAHTYAEHVIKMESRKFKSLTVPSQPNVLSRKGKELPLPPHPSQQFSIPASDLIKPRKKRMLTKNTIDQKLRLIHEKNKQKAHHLLSDVKNKNYHYAQTTKSDKYYKKIANIQGELQPTLEKSFQRPKPAVAVKNAPQVKQTAATIKRINKRIQMEEEEEVEWLKNIICYRNTSKIEEVVKQDRQEKERERLLNIEKKHLLGLITYEEAVLAKKKLVDDNKKKYEEFMKEKQSWYGEIERWQKLETEKNRQHIEDQCLNNFNVIQARHEAAAKKKETVQQIKKEKEELIADAMKSKQEELERRINMIKEIKILEIMAKKARVPKVIDLTETPELGLLCEMSMAELQERLCAMKISVKEELERKRKAINEEKKAVRQDLEETKSTIKNYMDEREQMRKQNKKLKATTNLNEKSSKNISDLKKILEEKRNLRIKLNNPLLP